VTQRAGDVFYRVDRGGRFEVATPHGTVRVTGTCFRVELDPTMKTPWQGVAGAAIGAALVVTVYEGSVLFAGRGGDERALAAGEVLATGEDGAPIAHRGRVAGGAAGRAEPALPEPPPDASRDELLRRDAVQRAEIASLRSRMRDLERGGGPVSRLPGGMGARDPSGRPWFDPSKEDLARFARECRVRNDTPSFLRPEPYEWGPDHPVGGTLSEEDRARANRILAALERELLAELRGLYIEVTGDAARADDLSPEAMASELSNKSPDKEGARINRRLAAERAGLATPPADRSQLSPLERFMRRQSSLGDEVERRLGEALGAGRARALREQEGGWDAKMESVACPSQEETGVQR
jgi:hypothetical protein